MRRGILNESFFAPNCKHNLTSKIKSTCHPERRLERFCFLREAKARAGVEGSLLDFDSLLPLSDCAAIDFLFQVGEELVEGAGALVAFGAVADGYCAGFGFFAADYEHVGDFLQLGVADFSLHFFVALVEFDANARGKQFLHHFCGVSVLAFRDGQDCHLHWSEPRRKRSAVKFDQVGNHALHRAYHASMDYYGAMLLAIGANVAEIELVRQMEIDLNRGIGL